MTDYTSTQTQGAVTSRTLWFGLLGGALAWMAHLLLAWYLAEAGCVAPFLTGYVLGLPALSLVLGAATVAAAAVAVLALLTARRNGRRLADGEPEALRGAGRYMARAGLLLSSIFLFIILFESIPLFFFDPCLS